MWAAKVPMFDCITIIIITCIHTHMDDFWQSLLQVPFCLLVDSLEHCKVLAMSHFQCRASTGSYYSDVLIQIDNQILFYSGH